ncbi:Tether containing UBX domain for GLUT4 [Cladobotryum mycophilum]|uniref:Tether containing UBX domain for GLUT4 n=1 Tax=Cladobotryum mycophilum TaxID=491253 RepID=A0ABR0S6J7_9HYPO
MSSHVVVIATDLRRTTIKVTPGTYLSDVLEQACKKLNLDSTRYLVKCKQKQVDLSVPFRTSGLVSGAKLELVIKSNTPSAVQIALQLPHPEAKEIPGGRLIKKFPSDLLIWQILRQFESGEASAGKNINITARGVAETANGTGSGGGQLYYETPVLNIMGRELATFMDFQKTMSHLGHNSGSVLIRLSFKKTDQTLYDAMAQIGQYFKEEGAQQKEEEAPAAQDTLSEDKTEEPAQKEDQDTTMEEAPAEPSGGPNDTQEPLIQEPNSTSQSEETSQDGPAAPRDKYQPVGVFLAPSGSTPAAALTPMEETDFTPTIAHAQLHQQRLLESSRNKRLLSDKEIEEKEATEQARIAAVQSVLVKVRFPDNTSSDWQIGPAETGAFLYAAVRHVMASSDQPFHLVIPGSKVVIKDDDTPRHSLVKAYKFAGRILVSLVWEDGVPLEVRKQPFLKGNVASQGQAVKVQDIPTVEEEDAGGSSAASKVPRVQKRDDGDGSAKKVPKWFKFGKK